MKTFKSSKAAYIASHNQEDCKSMFDNFVDGIQSVVEMLYQMCMKWTPAHLRKLANKIENAKCSSLMEYRKYVKTHPYSVDYDIGR